MPSSPRQALSDIALCLVFFTRLPLPMFDFRGRALAGAIWAAPFAGLAVASLGVLAYAAASACGLAASPASALALAATMLSTGCLHEDGLSDIADGFGGGATRERKLEIMRDSRIGAYGACALAMSVLLRWSALSELGGIANVLAALVAAHLSSRGLMGAFMFFLPAARSDGLSAAAGTTTRQTALAGAALGVLALFCLGFTGAIVALILLCGLFVAFRALCLRQVGGHTGDTLGAFQQFGEIALLLVASASLT